MITHVALNSHPNPKRVLVIGGGDGGVLREIVKHDVVESATLVEIDESVITLSKKYLPGMAKGFDHPKVNYIITDGFEYLKSVKNQYDVIITDSSDPDGPAEALFKTSYFELMFQALTDQGIYIMQASENVWLRLNLLKALKQSCRQVFPNVEYTHACVPTYTSGQLGLMMCCKDAGANLRIPARHWDDETERSINKYYNRRVHEASFVLPTFARNALA